MHLLAKHYSYTLSDIMDMKHYSVTLSVMFCLLDEMKEEARYQDTIQMLKFIGMERKGLARV